MNQENRVLSRKGARELSPAEVEKVTGAVKVRTETLCSFGPMGPDGDVSLGECSR